MEKPAMGMHRREALKLCAAVAASSVGASSTARAALPAPAPEAVAIGSRRELFVDRFLIDAMTRAELRLHPPVDRGPALAFDKPWEGAFCGYVTILHEGGRYRAYYRGLPEVDGRPVVCLAESADGLHWTRPALSLVPGGGSNETNVVLAGDSFAAHNFSPMIDARPDVDVDAKYKALCGLQESGLFAYVSADGVHWRKLRDRPVFTRADAGVRAGGKPSVFDSQNVSFWSTAERKYLLFYRIYEDGKRRIARVESDDYVHWKNPLLMEYRRGGEAAPVEQLYTSQTQPYFRAPHIYIATAARFMQGRRVLTSEQAAAIHVDPRYFDDASDAVFLSSRGGGTYDRTFMGAFVAPGIGAENWVSRTNYPALNVVQTGPNEMSLYVNQNYGQPTAHLRRYSLRLDGFVSVHADYDGGEMRTRPLAFEGSKLFLNFATSAAGGVKVEIQEPDGAPVPGFSLADCRELIGNEIERAATFAGGDLRPLAGRPLRLRFVMKDADVFALRFGDDPADRR